MANFRPGVYTVVKVTKFFCRFVDKHEGTIREVLSGTLSDEQLAIYDAAVLAIQALCSVFNIVYPLIKP